MVVSQLGKGEQCFEGSGPTYDLKTHVFKYEQINTCALLDLARSSPILSMDVLNEWWFVQASGFHHSIGDSRGASNRSSHEEVWLGG